MYKKFVLFILVGSCAMIFLSMIQSSHSTFIENKIWYADLDGDGFGDSNNYISSDIPVDGYVLNDLDCDDSNLKLNPGAVELCDGIDNDCDGLIDDGDPDLMGIPVWYKDADGDGFGNAQISIKSCNKPEGYVENNSDCDDTDKNINPYSVPIC